MSTPLNRNKLIRPEIILSELIKKFAQGRLLERDENIQILQRATVMAVDVVGGMLENPSGEGSVSHDINGKRREFKAIIGPKNPKNSIKARITDGVDQFFDDDSVRIFWPLFQDHMSMPLKPGEHVYVMFEDVDSLHGLWVGKVSGHENVNFFEGATSYKLYDESLKELFGASNEKNEEIDESYISEYLGSNLKKLFGV